MNVLVEEQKKARPDTHPTSARVMIIIATDPIGGPGKGLLQFLKYAPRDEFQYVLCNFRFKNRPLGEFCQEAMRHGINLKLLHQRAVIDPTLVFQVLKLIKENRINILQTHGYKGNILGYLVSRLHPVPWVAFAHGYTSDNAKIRMYNRLDKMVLRKADRVVVVSKSLKALLEDSHVPGDIISVIHNAIDEDGFLSDATPDQIKGRHDIKNHQKIIGVVGRLNPEKGQMVFLRGFQEVVRAFPETRALIIGDGQDMGLLKEFCKLHRLESNVVFTGYQSDISAYYRVLDIFVLPSLSEGLPNAVLEAMSFGIPVICTSVGGVPEVIDGDNGILVPANDHQALAGKMIELLVSEGKRVNLGKKGRESLFPAFDPLIRATRFLGLYTELLSHGHIISRSGQW